MHFMMNHFGNIGEKRIKNQDYTSPLRDDQQKPEKCDPIESQEER
jgi:hypothetical protein